MTPAKPPLRKQLADARVLIKQLRRDLLQEHATRKGAVDEIMKANSVAESANKNAHLMALDLAEFRKRAVDAEYDLRVANRALEAAMTHRHPTTKFKKLEDENSRLRERLRLVAELVAREDDD